MNERVIENWLDNANERTFQIPFCHSLAAEGHQVIHMSRHCAMEMGKDILSIAPDRVPCAYQLKDLGGKQLTLSKWRSDLERQIIPLVHNQIVHPSISSRRPHRSYIVINGELSEEVSNSIDQFNRGLRGRPNLTVILRGQLLDRFKRLGSALVPSDISAEFKLLLELLLTDGKQAVPKEKLANLLESSIAREARSKTKSGIVAQLAGAAILASYAISSFQRENNHAAEFEGWTMLFANILGVAERAGIKDSSWKPIAQLVSASMFNSLGRLCDEAIKRKTFVEGDIFADMHVQRTRLTYLNGLFGLYGLWRRKIGIPEDSSDEFLRKFSTEHTPKMLLWGEAATPQFLGAYFYQRTVDPSPSSERLLVSLIRGICARNHPRSEKGLSSPYYDAEHVLLDLLGDEESSIKENFAGSSYSLEGLFHLVVRCNLKQTAKILWPDISRISYNSFRPQPTWRLFQWRASNGLTTQRLHKSRQHWCDLVDEAADVSGREIPRRLREFPIECLALFLVYPHRLTASAVRWLDCHLGAS